MRDSYEEYTSRKEDEVKQLIKNELDKQMDCWNDFIKQSILTMFLTPDIKSGFFVHKENLRKRSNLSFDERILMRAPNNIELRLPVALRIQEGEVEAYDPYGSLKIQVNREPEYALEEDKIYILTLVKKFPMYPYKPVLEEEVNGFECHLTPTPLPLYAEPEDDSDYTYLAELPNYIGTESEAIDIITKVQNLYRLNDYYVERKDALNILVEGKETFLISYSSRLHCMKLGILIDS